MFSQSPKDKLVSCKHKYQYINWKIIARIAFITYRAEYTLQVFYIFNALI